MKKSYDDIRDPRAFSLVEVTIALGVFAILLIGTAVILGSMLTSARRIVETDHALSSVGALNEWLRQREFSTVYRWTKDETELFLYSFRATTNLPSAEGSDHLFAVPASPNALSAGRDYLLHVALRPAGDPKMAAEIGSIEGRLYSVTLKPATNNPAGTILPAFESHTNAYLALTAIVQEVLSRSPDDTAKKQEVMRFPVIINQ